MSAEDDAIAAMIARVEAEARRKVAAAVHGSNSTSHIWGAGAPPPSSCSSAPPPQPPQQQQQQQKRSAPAAAVGDEQQEQPAATAAHVHVPDTTPCRLRSASPTPPAAQPWLDAAALQAARAEKETAVAQLQQAKQALLTERTLVDAKSDEFRSVVDALRAQLQAEKEAAARAALERGVECDELRRRGAELEAEVATLRAQQAAAGTHLQQRGVEASALSQSLELSTRARAQDGATLARREAELAEARTQAAEAEKVIVSQKAELEQLVEANEQLTTQLRAGTAENEKLSEDVHALRLRAMETGHSEEAMARVATEAESLAGRRGEEAAAAQAHAVRTEAALAEAQAALQELTHRAEAAERRAAVLEAAHDAARATLHESESAAGRNQSHQDAAVARLKGAIAELELKVGAAEAEAERARALHTAACVEARALRHELEANAEDWQRRAGLAEADGQRLRAELAAQAAAAAQTEAALEERLGRDRAKTKAQEAEGEELRGTVSRLRIALKQAGADLASEQARRDAAVEIAGDDARLLREQLSQAQEEAAASEQAAAAAGERAAQARRLESEKEFLEKRIEEMEGSAREHAGLGEQLREQVRALERVLEETREKASAAEGQLVHERQKAADARALQDSTAKSLDDAKASLLTATEQLDKCRGVEVEREELIAKIAELEAASSEAASQKEREATQASKDLEHEVGLQKALLATKESELESLRAEREQAYLKHIDTCSALAQATGAKDVLAAEIAQMRETLAAAEAAAVARTEAGDEAGRRLADVTAELDNTMATRSELVSAVWGLLTDLGAARQGFSNILTNQTLRTSLIRSKNILDELHKILDRLTKTRQQAKWAMAEFLTDTEKLRYGASEWKDMGPRLGSASLRSSSACSTRRVAAAGATAAAVPAAPAPTTPRSGLAASQPKLAMLRSFTVGNTFDSPRRYASPLRHS